MNSTDPNFEPRIRYHHFEISGTDGGRATIAYVMDKNRNSDTRTIKFACSFCNPGDQFIKRKGRAKSAGRLISDGEHYSMNVSIKSDTEGYFSIINGFLREFCLARTPYFPIMRKSFYALNAIIPLKLKDLPDVCMFIESSTGRMFQKNGPVIFHSDGIYPAPQDKETLCLTTDEYWLNDAINLVKS